MLLYPHDALACWTEGGFFFLMCVCVRAFLPVCRNCDCVDVRHASCVGVYPCLCTCPAWVCVQPPSPSLPHIPVMLDTPPPPLPLHQHIKHYLQNNTIMWDKASFWVSIKERAGKQQKLACTTWPYGKGGGWGWWGGDEVVWEGICKPRGAIIPPVIAGPLCAYSITWRAGLSITQQSCL